MQIAIEQTEGLERIIDITLEAGNIQPKVEEKLTELGKEVRLKGFRQGRVPRKMLVKRFGEHVRGEVVSELMQESIEKALTDNELTVASRPEVIEVDDKKAGDCHFKVKVELMPEIPELDHSSLKVEKVNAEVADGDIDAMLENLQKQRQDWSPSKGKVANGDLVTIEYKAEGEITYPAEGVEKMGIVLGESAIPKELKKAIIGLKVTESDSLEVTFPEVFNVAELAGKTAKLSFEITDVRKAKLPKIDAEFIKSFGIESGDLDEFKADIRKNLERELGQTVKDSFKKNALKSLRAACKDVLLPASMINNEAEHIMQTELQRASQMGMKEAPALKAEDFKELAEERILNGLIVQDIAKRQDIKTDFAKVREQINEIAQTFEDPQQVVQLYYKNPDLMANIEQGVIETQVMDWIAEQVQIENKNMTFDELMKPQNA